MLKAYTAKKEKKNNNIAWKNYTMTQYAVVMRCAVSIERTRIEMGENLSSVYLAQCK